METTMLEYHPIANIFPLMAGDDYTALVADIAEHGLIEPIWLYQGKVLDGRNRLRACNDLGFVPEFREYTGDDPQSFVVSLNLVRRHLTREQRNDVIRQLRGNGMTLQKIADAVGVSVDTAHRVTRDIELSDFGKLPGDDGKYRPMHYVARAVELETDDEEPEPPDRHYTVFGEGGTEETLTVGPDEEIAVVKMAHVGNNSGDNEWYTPAPYIEAARAVMGSIDLDPASTETANSVVKAATFYTADDNGLLYDWQGNIWMNPPYAQPLIAQFSTRLQEEWAAGRVSQAIVLVNNATETAWFQGLVRCASAVCFPLARVKFWSPDKVSAPLQGQAVLYLGQDVDSFVRHFGAFGWCAEVR
jgi:ParB family chromosome partitioning protein